MDCSTVAIPDTKMFDAMMLTRAGLSGATHREGMRAKATEMQLPIMMKKCCEMRSFTISPP